MINKIGKLEAFDLIHKALQNNPRYYYLFDIHESDINSEMTINELTDILFDQERIDVDSAAQDFKWTESKIKYGLKLALDLNYTLENVTPELMACLIVKQDIMEEWNNYSKIIQDILNRIDESIDDEGYLNSLIN